MEEQQDGPDYHEENMHGLEVAGIAAGLGEPYYYVEVVYPKVRFRRGDLNIDFIDTLNNDEPRPGYGFDVWDDVTSTALENAYTTGFATPDEAVAGALRWLTAHGLVTGKERDIIAAAVHWLGVPLLRGPVNFVPTDDHLSPEGDLRCPVCGSERTQWADDGEADLADWWECMNPNCGCEGALLSATDATQTQNGLAVTGHSL
jgi:hypothetical protein